MNRSPALLRTRWIGWVLLLGVVCWLAFVRSLPVADALERFGDWNVAIPIATLGVAVGVVVGIPGSVLAVVGGGLFGAKTGFAVCWIGCVVGASICFWVSGQLLRDRIGRLFDGRRWHRIVASVLTSGGWKALALLRLTPLVPFVVLNYLSAPMGVRFGAYLNGTALAIVPAVFVWAMIGASARMELLEEVGMRWLRWGLTGIGVIATLGLGIWARRSIGEHVARHA